MHGTAELGQRVFPTAWKKSLTITPLQAFLVK